MLANSYHDKYFKAIFICKWLATNNSDSTIFWIFPAVPLVLWHIESRSFLQELVYPMHNTKLSGETFWKIFGLTSACSESNAV